MVEDTQPEKSGFHSVDSSAMNVSIYDFGR